MKQVPILLKFFRLPRDKDEHSPIQFGVDIQIPIDQIPEIILCPAIFPPLYMMAMEHASGQIALIFSLQPEDMFYTGPCDIVTRVEDESLYLIVRDVGNAMSDEWQREETVIVAAMLSTNDEATFRIDFFY